MNQWKCGNMHILYFFCLVPPIAILIEHCQGIFDSKEMEHDWLVPLKVCGNWQHHIFNSNCPHIRQINTNVVKVYLTEKKWNMTGRYVAALNVFNSNCPHIRQINTNAVDETLFCLRFKVFILSVLLQFSNVASFHSI